jgi:micrococcal nuclease
MFIKLIARVLFSRTRTRPSSIVRSERPKPVIQAPPVAEIKPAPTPPQSEARTTTVSGRCYVIDGDTIQIGDLRIRLAGIDAPELDHPWGNKAKWELVALCKGQSVTATLEPDISYDRVVATCTLPDGRDLSAEMVKRGMAIDWAKFSGGKYRHLEPEGVRKKHWKAAARQQGRMEVFNK